MIPKIIHYCWLSGEPIPSDYNRYLNTWRKYLPDYELILWDSNRFDIKAYPWVYNAVSARKYAFAADYIRMYALYNYGGLYFDMDVQVVKNMDELLSGKVLFGYETDSGILDGKRRIEAAVIGCEPGQNWAKECLDYYNSHEFYVNADGNVGRQIKVLPVVLEECMVASGFKLVDINDQRGLVGGDDNTIPVLPSCFLSPKSSNDRYIFKSESTYTIHHFSGAWLPFEDKAKNWIGDTFGYSFLKSVMKFRKYILKFFGHERK